MKKLYVFKPLRQGKIATTPFGRLYFSQTPRSEMMKTVWTDIEEGIAWATERKYMYIITD